MSAHEAKQRTQAQSVASQAPASQPRESGATDAQPSSVDLATAQPPSSGLISAILGRGQSADEGALAALRTLPRRAAPDPDFTDPIGEHRRVGERVELLLELMPDKPAAVQARLLTRAAELLTQLGETDRAHASYLEAVEKDPSQPLAAQQLYRSYMRRGQWNEAAQLLEKVCAATPDTRERALMLATRAELASRVGATSEQVVALLEQARDVHPGSLLAQLLLARTLLQAGRQPELAQVLCDAAALCDLPRTRALLWLEAGRVLERASLPERALHCYEQALAAEAGLLGALLGIARLQLAQADRAAAAVTLAKLSTLEKHAELQAEWTRQRGLLLLDGLGEPAQAAKVLHAQRSAPGLRALMRAAEAAGEHAAHERALGAWAQASGGLMRSLASAEQARARRRSRPDLHADPQGHSRAAQRADQAGGDQLLRQAAQLPAGPESLAEEHRLLHAVPPDDPAFLEADVLGLDVAAELSELGRVRACLCRDIERWPDNLRAGSLIAALDLDGVDHTRPEQTALWERLSKLAQGQPVVTRYLAARAPSPEHSAAFWLAEALVATGPQAAFAATSAGHYLEMAGLDATEAYLDALDATRGYLPAAFGMEISARAQADLSALERIHREVADTCAGVHERSARYIRLGLLNADSDLSAAAHWLRLAAEDVDADAILDELSIRLAMDQSPAHQAELLESAAERQSSPINARAMRLQAAEAHEMAGQWDDAVRLYRQQLADDPGDIFTDCALMTCLRRRGRPAALAAELERRARECDEPARRAILLEEWAHAEQASGQPRRAQALLQRAVAERAIQAPVSALRALERQALQSDDTMGIMRYAQQLSEACEERLSSAAELRLCIRAARKLGADVYAPLMAAEGRVRESWYARELEALALRNGDRARHYEAMWLQSELARDHEPLERAAYALRAAEIVELTAPDRAARELADALSAAREHPFGMEQLARLLKAAGDARAAAHTFARAARFSASLPRTAALHYTAGVLFQDELDEPAYAIENLRKAAKLDLLFADTFARLRLLLKREGHRSELLALLDARLALPIEAKQAAQLHLDRYQLLVEQPEPDQARAALVAALGCDPASAQALLALGELQQRCGEYRAAADVWLKLTQLLDEPQVLAETYARLGGLFQDHLADPVDAERAYRQALTQVPEQRAALEGLVQLYLRQERFAEALQAVEALLASELAGGERERWVIQKAELHARLGNHGQAIETLELAERLAPTSLPLLRTHAALLLRAGAHDTREAVLLRGCEALRAAIEIDPSEPQLWLGLHELLGERGATDAAALVAHAAQALGVSHPDLPNAAPRGLGADALAPSVFIQIAPRGALQAVASLLRELEPLLAPHLPFETAHEPMPAGRARDLAPAITRDFGLGELRVSRCEPSLCLPLSAAPLHVCLGSDWLDQASDAERTFALLRAIALAKLDLSLLSRCAPERFGLVLNALWSIADRTHMVVVLDADEQKRVADELSHSLDPQAQARVKQLIDAVVEQAEIHPRRLQSSAFDYGSRLALCVTADVWSGLSSLLLMRGKQAARLDPREKIEQCRTDPALRGLLSFAISEAYAQARRSVLEAHARERG